MVLGSFYFFTMINVITSASIWVIGYSFEPSPTLAQIPSICVAAHLLTTTVAVATFIEI